MITVLDLNNNVLAVLEKDVFKGLNLDLNIQYSKDTTIQHIDEITENISCLKVYFESNTHSEFIGFVTEHNYSKISSRLEKIADRDNMIVSEKMIFD